MTVIPFQSLPLGFRFHPTDEELMNHYLKRKINGRIRSEIEVIPEIDVCKCEPWDLPDKALIISDDPEWFFFSPKDRKYPNGHRSNRATEAGYWKATGKDRTIKTKAPAAMAVIGMKKTLVFHRGRAPKGVRTNWIMHEYRATEPEFESGEQGGYVLYRLFRKPEERGPTCNREEIDMSGLSSTPTKSSPGDTQHDADIFEEIETPIELMPLNQASPVSGIHKDSLYLPNASESQPSGITRWLADKGDRTSMKPEDGDCDNLVAVEQEVEAGAVVDPLLEALGAIYDTEEQLVSNEFPSFSSPMRPYSDHPFVTSTDQESHMGFYQNDLIEHDSLDEFLNSILGNQDEYSEGSKVPPMSTTEVTHSRCSSEVDTEVGLAQGGVGLHNPGWFSFNASNDYREINSVAYESASLLPYNSIVSDVYSVDSGMESVLELFNSMHESNGHMSDFSNGVSVETGTTDIKIRPRQPQHPALDDLPAQQGFAQRRIRLQCSVQVGKGLDFEDRNANASSRLKFEDLSIHDDTEEPSVSDISVESKPNEITVSDQTKDSAAGLKTSTPDVAMNYVVSLVAMITILVLLCVVIWRWKGSQSLFIAESSI